MGHLAQNLHDIMKCIQYFISEVNTMGLIECNSLVISCTSEFPHSALSSYLSSMRRFVNNIKVISDAAAEQNPIDQSSFQDPKNVQQHESLDSPDLFLNTISNICNGEINESFGASSMSLLENEKQISNHGEKLSNSITASCPLIDQSQVESLNSYDKQVSLNSQPSSEYSHSSDVLYSLSNLSVDSDKREPMVSRDSHPHSTGWQQGEVYATEDGMIATQVNQDMLVTTSNIDSSIDNKIQEKLTTNKVCEKCGFSSLENCTCFKSLKSDHSERKLSSHTHHPCDKCNRVFRKWKHLSYHYHKVHQDEEPVKEAPFALQSNIPENGGDLPLFCCKTCNIACLELESFNVHNCKLSEEEDPDIPPVNNRILITNVLKLHQMRKFICNVCHIEYRTFKRILYHLPRCSPGPYSCNRCSHLFQSQKELNYHKRKSHKGEKCFTCNECGKGFLRATSLRKHSINRHELLNASDPLFYFKCDLCPKTFIKKIYLTNHKLRMHNLDKKFLCQVCGKRFMSKNSLSVHMESHREMKKFECQFCQRKFRKKEKMQHHERIHTGERPFQCEKCSKTFVSKGRLSEHEQRHKSEKRYCCPLCSKSYAAAWDLKKHTRKCHNKDLESAPVKIIPSRNSSLHENEQSAKSSEGAAASVPSQVISIASNSLGTLTIPIVHRVQGCQVSHLGHVVQFAGSGQMTGHNLQSEVVSPQVLQSIQSVQQPDYTVHTVQTHTIQATPGAQILPTLQPLSTLPAITQTEYPIQTIQTLPGDVYVSQT